MNRAQRRRRDRRDDELTRRVRALERRVEQTGRPGYINGLTDACVDCSADGGIVLLPGKRVIHRVFHDEGCPAAAGVVSWQPVPLDND